MKGRCTAIATKPASEADHAIWHKLLAQVMGDASTRTVLNDLIQALSSSHAVVPSCARAMEGIRSAITPGSDNREKGWPIMRERLNIDRPYLQFITDKSTGPRHGDRSDAIPASLNVEILQRSWEIMNRFLIYKQRGDQRLPILEFPLLTAS